MTLYRGEVVNARGTIRESQIAVAGQDTFTFSSISYAVNSNGLRVYVNGLRIPQADYVESSSTSVVFNDGLQGGDEVLFEVIS